MSDALQTADEARIEAILRSMTEADLMLENPPASVWAGIEAELTTGEPAIFSLHGDATVASVIDLAARRTRRVTVALGAVAAATVVLIVGLSVGFSSSTTDLREVASADLEFAADFDPGGEGHFAATTLLEGDTGQRIRFDAADLPAPSEGEDVELWLIGIDEEGAIEIIQPVAILDDLADPGTFDVPEDFSVADYATVAVDLSFEPRDGVETHSGRSILRGALTA